MGSFFFVYSHHFSPPIHSHAYHYACQRSSEIAESLHIPGIAHRCHLIIIRKIDLPKCLLVQPPHYSVATGSQDLLKEQYDGTECSDSMVPIPPLLLISAPVCHYPQTSQPALPQSST